MWSFFFFKVVWLILFFIFLSHQGKYRTILSAHILYKNTYFAHPFGFFLINLWYVQVHYVVADMDAGDVAIPNIDREYNRVSPPG